MSSTQFSKITLRSRPVADIIPEENFQTEHASLSSLVPGAKQVLVKVTYLSLDPAMRGWMRDTRSYLPPVQIGETMRAGGLGVVVQAGEGSKFAKGDTVYGTPGAHCSLIVHSDKGLIRGMKDGPNTLWWTISHAPRSSMLRLYHIHGPNSQSRRPPKGTDALDFLNTLGMPGMTAYFVRSPFPHFS